MLKWHIILKIISVYSLIVGFFIFLLSTQPSTKGIIFNIIFTGFFGLIILHLKNYYKNLSELENLYEERNYRILNLDKRLVKSEEKLDKVFYNLDNLEIMKKTLNE